MILDAYYRRPLIYDYAIAWVVSSIFYYLHCKNIIGLPTKEIDISTSTDLSTISFTIAGFILTLLTVLITFKTGAKIPNSKGGNDNVALFDMFFSTRLYFDTTKLLKNAIKSLTFIAIIGFLLKLLLNGDSIKYLFFFNLGGLIIISLTLLRSLLILNKIIDLQKNK